MTALPTTRPSADRRAGPRRIVRPGSPLLGLGGQVLNAATNAATAYTASFLLHPAAFGSFVIGLAAVTVVLAVGRGLIGTTVLVHLPGVDEAARPALGRSALGFTALAGIAATALLLVASWWVAGLVWFVPWIAVALLQDVARHLLLADRRPGASLGLDVAWALTQAGVLLGAVAAGTTLTVGWLATAWGLGALAGLVVFASGPGRDLRPAVPAVWARTTRDVAGWFTASSILGQVELYLVLLLAGLLLGPAEAGTLRAVQLLALQPAMVLLGGILTVATPAMARHHAAGVIALRAGWGRMVVAVVPVVLLITGVVALAGPLTHLLFPQYVDAAPLVTPVGLQAVAVALTVPSLALLTGTRRGALAFGLHTGRVAVVLAAAVAGASTAGATGLVWGQAVATGAGLVAATVLARTLLRHPERSAV